MSTSPSAQASWNCVLESSLESTQGESEKQICIHNDMNKLQSIPYLDQPGSPGRVFVSLNPTRTPLYIQYRQIYHHPIIDSKSVHATRRLHLINNTTVDNKNISFAGAWMGYAFHEDGFNAGLAVARKLSTGKYENPTSVRYGEDLAEWIPKSSIGNCIIRAGLSVIQFVIELVEWFDS
jgi:predicted NAD/FAD-binding protein